MFLTELLPAGRKGIQARHQGFASVAERKAVRKTGRNRFRGRNQKPVFRHNFKMPVGSPWGGVQEAECREGPRGVV